MPLGVGLLRGEHFRANIRREDRQDKGLFKTFNNSVRSRDLRVPTTTAHKIKRLRLCHCAVRAPSDVWVRAAARVPDLTNLIRHSPPPWCFYVSPAVCPKALSTPPPTPRSGSLVVVIFCRNQN